MSTLNFSDFPPNNGDYDDLRTEKDILMVRIFACEEELTNHSILYNRAKNDHADDDEWARSVVLISFALEEYHMNNLLSKLEYELELIENKIRLEEEFDISSYRAPSILPVIDKNTYISKRQEWKLDFTFHKKKK